MQISAEQLAQLLGGRVDGDPQVVVSNLAKIEEAGPTDLSFIANPKYEKYATQTQAGILIVRDDLKPDGPVAGTLVRVADPYGSFTKLLELYQQQQNQRTGIEQPSFIADSAKVGEACYVGAFAYIGEGAVIEDGVKIYPHVYVGDGVKIGKGTTLFSGVKVYHQCQLGQRVIIHSGTIVGGDGFGFAPQADGSFAKVPQTGNVVIEDDVEIGANCTIDRATLGSTYIRKGAKLDNLIQVAHNVEIGSNTVIAAQTGISGSTKIGKGAMIGGQVGVVGHIQLADGVKIQAQSGIGKSITKEGSAWAGSPAFDHGQNLRSQIIFRNLPELERRLRDIEAQLNDR